MIVKKYTYYLILAISLFVSASNVNISNANISWDQSGFNTSTMIISGFDFNKIFNELSLPKIDFTKNTRQINQNISDVQFQKYKIDFNQWINDFEQNSLLRNSYSYFIEIITFIGGIVIWILEFMLVIVRRMLSFIL